MIPSGTILRIGRLSSPRRVARLSKSCRGRLRTLMTQLIRSSGSIGANYIEANEAIGKKDFVMKIKTCRREAKESGYWLRLLDCDRDLEPARTNLLGEARELTNIFGAIVRKSEV